MVPDFWLDLDDDHRPPVRPPAEIILRCDGDAATAKRWRIEHASGRWRMQPEGSLGADEARALCRRIVNALAHCDADGIPAGDWHPPFWAGWLVGLATAGALGLAWATVATSLTRLGGAP